MIGSLKLDGLRVICEVIVDEEEVNFLSRTGNPITSLDHLKPAMLELGKLSGYKHIFSMVKVLQVLLTIQSQRYARRT
jgi:DNA ligase-1